MSGLPSVDYEVDVLNAFISAVERPDAPLDDMLEAAQDHAHAFRTRLETPVRVAFSGFPGSGKSSLINLLVGQDVLPVGRQNFATPAIIVRHARTEKTIAGWWDRPNQEIDGLNLDAAFSLNPDVVSIEIDCDVLKDLWLIDISGLGDKDHGKRALFALMRLADLMLWCSNVKEPVLPNETEIWRSVPGRLMRNSLLVLTHSDVAKEGDKATETQFDPDRIKSFRDTIPIATAAAMQALRGEVDDPATVWQDSGADHLVTALMTAAVEARETELEKARRGIDKFIVPAQQKLDAFYGTKTVIKRRPAPARQTIDKEAIIPAASAKAPQTTPATPEPAAAAAPAGQKSSESAAIWLEWLSKMRAISSELQSGSLDDNAEFIETAQHLVDEFRDFLAESGTLPPKEDWLIDEFEKANDLLILLQFENAQDVAIDAARVLVQLSESLATAGV